MCCGDVILRTQNYISNDEKTRLCRKIGLSPRDNLSLIDWFPPFGFSACIGHIVSSHIAQLIASFDIAGHPSAGGAMYVNPPFHVFELADGRVRHLSGKC